MELHAVKEYGVVDVYIHVFSYSLLSLSLGKIPVLVEKDTEWTPEPV
jgi:hypothetical protein